MADIVTNTLQIGNDKLILRDADAQEKVTGLKEDLSESVGDLKSAIDTNNYLIYKGDNEIASHTGNNIIIQNGHVTINPNPSGYWKTLIAPVESLYINGSATLKTGGLRGNQSQSIPSFAFIDENYDVVGTPVYSTITAPHTFVKSDVPSSAVYVCACFAEPFTFAFKSINTRVSESNDAVTQIVNQTEGTKKTVDAMASLSNIVPNFAIGVYAYDPATDTMQLATDAARLTADLRELELAQGDSVGITDYTTYSIAFGDNGSGGAWYGGGYQSTDITANNSNIYPYIFLVKRNDNENITQTDINAIEAQFHYTGGKKIINITEGFAKSIRSEICNNNYLHFSFDDVAYCILNLVNNGASFNSLWNEPFFGMLKRLHDEYGAIFSLYIWDVANLANIPSKFKAEFMASSGWLKFGFHSYVEGSMAETSYNDAKTQYETFINYVFSKIGGVNSVDRVPRLNYFAGNVNALRALRDANCGCIGFLNTDDTRSAYYLTQEELAYLRTHSLWSDRTNGLQFVSTVMRLDWFESGFSSQYDYNVPVEDNPYDELVYRYGRPAMADLYSTLIVFTHEWQTYSSSYVLNTAMVNRVEQVCRFANEYGYDFDYPQNRIPNVTSYAVD